MKHLKLLPKSLSWQSVLVLMLVGLMLVQVAAVSLALAVPDGGAAASQAVAWEDTKPPPPPPPPPGDDGGKGGGTTEGYDWGG